MTVSASDTARSETLRATDTDACASMSARCSRSSDGSTSVLLDSWSHGDGLGVPCATMKILYKPFGIIVGIIAGILARQVFSQIWGRIDEREPPKPTTKETTWGKLLGAAAIQGAVFAVTKAVVNRSGAKGFQWLTGIWPGEKRPEKE